MKTGDRTTCAYHGLRTLERSEQEDGKPGRRRWSVTGAVTVTDAVAVAVTVAVAVARSAGTVGGAATLFRLAT
jgi:hypothetical protein